MELESRTSILGIYSVTLKANKKLKVRDLHRYFIVILLALYISEKKLQIVKICIVIVDTLVMKVASICCFVA